MDEYGGNGHDDDEQVQQVPGVFDVLPGTEDVHAEYCLDQEDKRECVVEIFQYVDQILNNVSD